MMDINEIRKENILKIIDARFSGKKASFAKAIEKPESQVYRMFNTGKNGRNISTSSARYIERKLNLDDGSLDYLNIQIKESRADYNTEPAIIKDGQIPVISWVQAGEFNEAIDLHVVGMADDYVQRINGGSKVYGLRVRGNSMTAPDGITPTFPEGYVIHVDPDQVTVSNDYVIAKINGENSVTFKQLKQGDAPYLTPLNPDYKPIYDEFRILGKVIGVSLKL